MDKEKLKARDAFVGMLKDTGAWKYYKECCVCGFKQFTELAHIKSHRSGGEYSFKNIIPLCANHHKTYDWGWWGEREKEQAGIFWDMINGDGEEQDGVTIEEIKKVVEKIKRRKKLDQYQWGEIEGLNE